METIFKPVRCILKSVKIRALRGQNSNEAPCNFGVRDESTAACRLRYCAMGSAREKNILKYFGHFFGAMTNPCYRR
jgi:hypothetical protein